MNQTQRSNQTLATQASIVAPSTSSTLGKASSNQRYQQTSTSPEVAVAP